MRARLQNLSGGAGKFFLRGTARLGWRCRRVWMAGRADHLILNQSVKR